MGQTVAERVVTKIEPRPGRFSGDISDLWFGHDVENCRVIARGAFEGWDERKLKEEAKLFLAALSRLGVEVPTVEELIADFYNRL